jgi:hypothetical protein
VCLPKLMSAIPLPAILWLAFTSEDLTVRVNHPFYPYMNSYNVHITASMSYRLVGEWLKPYTDVAGHRPKEHRRMKSWASMHSTTEQRVGAGRRQRCLELGAV